MAKGGVSVPLVLFQHLQRIEHPITRITMMRRMFFGLVGIPGCDVFEHASAVVTFDFVMHLLFVSCQPFQRAQCDIAFIAFVLGVGWVLHCTGGELDCASDIVSLWRMFGHPMTLNPFLRSKRLATYDTPLSMFGSFVRAQTFLSSEFLIALRATLDGWMLSLFVATQGLLINERFTASLAGRHVDLVCVKNDGWYW